jgi:hypothetical protein
MKTPLRTIICLYFWIWLPAAHATVYHVEKTGDDSNAGTSPSEAFQTLHRAFLTLEDGDEVVVGEGVFTLTRTLEWDVALTLTGAGPDKTIIQALPEPVRDRESVFTYSVLYNQKPQNCDNTVPESLIRDLTIRHGAAPIREPSPTNVGGGVKNFAKLTLSNCVIEENVAFHGGAAYNAGNLHLENTIVRNNHAFGQEGAIFNAQGATFTESGSTFENNTSDHVDSGAYLINDFESGFFARSGTNGNYEGGLVENSQNFQIVDNPDTTGINPSEKVGRFTRDVRGNWWAYAWFEFEDITINDTPKYLHMMIYKPVISNVCVQVKNGHQPTGGNNTGEIVHTGQTKESEWEDLVFEINKPGTYSYIEIKPDFINATVSDRLSGDIEIYFDNIVINDDPEPRTRAEETLGAFPFPVGVFEETPVEDLFKPDGVSEFLEFSSLFYTDNLEFNYNYPVGYFRPYGWPEGDYDEEKFLEFTISPKEDALYGVSRIEINHKANTQVLGPGKVLVTVSDDGKETFEPIAVLEVKRDAFNTDQIHLSNPGGGDTLTFRFHAYESLLGTTGQRDFWIITGMAVYGTAYADPTTDYVSLPEPKGLMVYPNPSEGIVHVNLPPDKISVLKVYDLTGRQVMTREATGLYQLDLSGRRPGLYLLQVHSEWGTEVVKVLLN